MASTGTYVPPMWRRSLGGPLDRHIGHAGHTDERGTYPLLVLVAAAVFVVTAGALLLTQSGLFSRTTGATPATQSVAQPPPAAAPLAPSDLQNVLSYARTLRTDDPLVQVRPGVLAKKSNVDGIQVGDRTVFYDVVPHQSYGPLRSGKLSEQQVDILARDTDSGSLILVYVKK
jgi:hypothetical protein